MSRQTKYSGKREPRSTLLSMEGVRNLSNESRGELIHWLDKLKINNVLPDDLHIVKQPQLVEVLMRGLSSRDRGVFRSGYAVGRAITRAQNDLNLTLNIPTTPEIEMAIARFHENKSLQVELDPVRLEILAPRKNRDRLGHQLVVLFNEPSSTIINDDSLGKFTELGVVHEEMRRMREILSVNGMSFDTTKEYPYMELARMHRPLSNVELDRFEQYQRGNFIIDKENVIYNQLPVLKFLNLDFKNVIA